MIPDRFPPSLPLLFLPTLFLFAVERPAAADQLPARAVLTGSTAGPGHPRPEPGIPSRTVRGGPGRRAAADTVEAARPDTTEAVPLEELEVTVTRLEEPLLASPVAVSVLDGREEISSERRVSLEEVLEAVPGVVVSNRQNFSLGDRITIRGVGARSQFGVRGIKILADGIPLTLPDGQSTLTNLDLGSVSRIEVIRGPSAALYGNSAGGVLQLESAVPGDRTLRAEPRVSFGADGFRKEEVGLSGRIGRDWSYLFRGDHLETDGFRDHSEAETYRGNLVVRGKVASDTELRAVVNAFDTPFSENPSSLTREDARRRPRKARDFVVAQGAGESATQAQAGVTIRHDAGRTARFRATLWGLGRELRNPIPGRIIDLDRRAAGLRLEWRGGAGPRSPDRERPPLRWITGFDAELQRDDRLERENLGVSAPGERARPGARLLEQDEEVDVLAPFARLEVEPLRGLTAGAAVRWDRYRFSASDRLQADGDDSGTRTLRELSPTVGLSYAHPSGVGLYANFATAFETPTTSELSNRPDGEGGFDPELGPQEIRSFEGGVRGRWPGGRLTYDLAVHDARVDDALVPFEGPGEQIFFRNAGEISRQGVELALGWAPVRPLAARLSYSHLDARFRRFRPGGVDVAGNREPGIPDHRLFAEVEGRVLGGMRVSASLTWTDAFPVNDRNSAWNGSSRVLDLRLSDRRGVAGLVLRPFLGLDNVLDERHNGSVVPNAFGERFFEPAPGRRLFGGLEVGLPGRRGE